VRGNVVKVVGYISKEPIAESLTIDHPIEDIIDYATENPFIEGEYLFLPIPPFDDELLRLIEDEKGVIGTRSIFELIISLMKFASPEVNEKYNVKNKANLAGGLSELELPTPHSIVKASTMFDQRFDFYF